MPADNPFVGVDGARPEIWSFGLRNPWRFSFDRPTGDLWIADVGQDQWEEIDVGWAADGGGRGLNFGWSAFEGNHRFNDDQSADGVTPPIHEYEHVGQDCSISGGALYRGTAIPALVGWYVFADYCSGQVRALQIADRAEVKQVALGHGPTSVVAINEGPDGELYVPVERRPDLSSRDSPPESGDAFELRRAARDVGRHDPNPDVVARRDVVGVDAATTGRSQSWMRAPRSSTSVTTAGNVRCVCALSNATSARSMTARSIWFAVSSARRITSGNLGNAAATCRAPVAVGDRERGHHDVAVGEAAQRRRARGRRSRPSPRATDAARPRTARTTRRRRRGGRPSTAPQVFGSLGVERSLRSRAALVAAGQSMPKARAVWRRRCSARSSGSAITRNKPVPAANSASATARLVASDIAALSSSDCSRGRNDDVVAAVARSRSTSCSGGSMRAAPRASSAAAMRRASSAKRRPAAAPA